jgi:hypothetical protein
MSSRFVTNYKQHQQEAVAPDAETSGGIDMDAEALYRAEAEKQLDEEEELFNVEENITRPTTYTWEDKYRPRKPRYSTEYRLAMSGISTTRLAMGKFILAFAGDCLIWACLVQTTPHLRLSKVTRCILTAVDSSPMLK